jgi:hypothetical protein
MELTGSTEKIFLRDGVPQRAEVWAGGRCVIKIAYKDGKPASRQYDWNGDGKFENETK